METVGELKQTLKLWHVVMIGIGYMTPMVIFDTFGIVSEMTSGHVPTAYVLALIGMLFTAISYGHMVRVYPSAGSAYTYAKNTIHPHLGFLVGWSALLDYLFMPMVNALLISMYVTSIFPDIPSWVLIIGVVLLSTLINAWGVNIMANFNSFLVTFQFLVLAIFIVLIVRGLLMGEGTAHIVSAQPFVSEDMALGTLIAGATILCFSFLGFDAVTTLSEETPDPKKNIPRGILLVALIGGGLFIFVSYFIQSYFPDVTRFQDVEAAGSEIALYVGGTLFQSIFVATVFMANFASGLTSHASVSRLLYVMGRDKLLPVRLFGYVHPKRGTPVYNVIFVGLVSLTALFLDLVTAVSLLNFGALIAFTFVNLSVIAHYVVREQQYKTVSGFLKYFLSPLAGAITVGILWLNLESSSFMLGACWAVIGIAYLIYRIYRLRKTPLVELDESTGSIS